MLKKLLSKAEDKWHRTSSDWVFTEEETGAGHKVWFQRANVETHEETGERRVRFGSTRGPKFYDETQWYLATLLSDESDYETIVMQGPHEPTFPKGEYREKIE